MVKPKSQSKKRGVDFKKIKRKIGRKLPPPKNTTNTEIKSKAIVLPEQSIAAEKAGLAVSKKGLTLKELLQHTSHHNAKVRKDALIGIKDILVNHPAELKLHKLALVEKLRERIGDDDKLVRETLYQLFKSVILPSSAKDNQGPLVSLMMAYIFNAMTNLAIEVRLMAFRFFDIVVQYHPTSFSFYAEKILQNYEDILRRNQLLEDKGKLKNILIGLVQCLSLLSCNESEGHPTMKKDVASNDVLHAFETEVARNPIGITDIAKKSKDLLPVLVSCCVDLMPVSHATPKLDAQSCDCMLYILQSIDLLVRFLVCGKSGSEHYPQLPRGQKPDVATSDTFISILMLKKLWDLFPLNLAYHLSGKDEDKVFILNIIVTKIFLQLNDWNSPSAFLEKFLDFTESSLSMQIQSWKGFHEKHLVPLIPFIPKLTMQISGDWRYRLLQAFTDAFMKCNPESSMKVACLSAIEEMLDLERSWLYPDAYDPALPQYQITWLHHLPSLLILLDVKNPLCSKAVLRLQLCMGKAAPVNSLFSREYDNMQFGFRDFFSQQIDEGTCYGPFMKLSTEIKELAICCLHYFSVMDSQLLQSLVSCCLCDDLEPSLVFRILEALQSSFRAGHVPVAEYTSFHVTLLSRFQIYPEKIFPAMDYDGKSNRKIFKVITRVVCSCLAEIGDDYLVLQMLEKTIVDQICHKAPTDNKCAFLRLLVKLDSSPTRLSDQSIENISHVLPQYLIDVASNGEEYYCEPVSVVGTKRRQYYLIPCYYLFQRSERLLTRMLNVMGTMIFCVNSPSGSQHLHPSTDCSSRVCIISSILLHMIKDVKIRQLLLSCITQVKIVLQKLLIVLSSEEFKLTFEEKLKIQCAYDQLREMVDNEVVGHP